MKSNVAHNLVNGLYIYIPWNVNTRNIHLNSISRNQNIMCTTYVYLTMCVLTLPHLQFNGFSRHSGSYSFHIGPDMFVQLFEDLNHLTVANIQKIKIKNQGGKYLFTELSKTLVFILLLYWLCKSNIHSSFTSVFGLHQLLRKISGSLSAKFSMIFRSQ